MLKSTHRPLVGGPPQLPPGWTQHKAPTGHPYYYNAITKESTYTRPSQLLQPPSGQPHPAGSNYLQQPPQAFHAGYFNGTVAGLEVLHHSSLQRDINRERGSFKGGYNDRQRSSPQDRPKSKHPIPGCAPWLLVKTKLGRRFVHNPERGESFWKFPLEVMKGVVEYDRLDREKRSNPEISEGPHLEEDESAATAELALAESAPSAARAPIIGREKILHLEDDSEEYEEVEVTDDEDDEKPSKRQKTGGGELDGPVEFNEDDIAYQLAAMGQDYGLDPGEYGMDLDEGLEEGAEGLALTDEDANALFKDMLDDHHISPYAIWEKIIEAGQIIEDDRYTVLPNMKSRKETWSEWSRERIKQLKEQREREEKKDPRIAYFSFLQSYASPKLYWPEFRRKYKQEPALRDAKFSDKEREKAYRNYINRLKLPESTLKTELVAVLKSIPLHILNRSTSLEALPSMLLTDLRYISLRPSVRDPLVGTFIASLAPAPHHVNISPEEQEALNKQIVERERREKALAERQKQVLEEKKRQQGTLQVSKGMLRKGEAEIERAMRVGKDGLRSYMEVEE